jgi:hypothetical protein
MTRTRREKGRITGVEEQEGQGGRREGRREREGYRE